MRADGFVVRLLDVDVRPSALKHGVLIEDIEHAVRNAVAIEDLDDDLRLYLGSSRSGLLLEVIALMRTENQTERAKYRPLLPGGS